MEPIRVGVVGLGVSGYQLHAQPLSLLPGQFRIEAVCDMDPALAKQRGAEFKARVCSDVKALLADPAVELVVLAVPTPLHHPLALQALDAGKHVVVEKPMATTTRLAGEMVRRARERKRLLTVYFNRRRYAAFRTIRRLFAEDVFGRVYQFESGIAAWTPQLQGGWRTQAGTGGECFYDFGAHLVDEILTLFGSPERVFAEKWRVFGGPVDTGFRITLLYANGLTAVTRIVDCTRLPFPRYFIMAEKATLSGEPGNAWGELTLRVDKGDGTFEDRKPAPEEGTIETAARDFYQGLVAPIRQGAPLPVKPEEAYAVTRVLEAAALSAAERRVVALSEKTTPPLD